METFTQPKITGYRQLNETEAALMNEVKAKGVEIDALIARVREHVAGQRGSVVLQRRAAQGAETVPAAAEIRNIASIESVRLDWAEPERWASIARTHFQEGLMALTRAVAQPSSF